MDLTTVTFNWSNRYGPCLDCGLPSAYSVDGSDTYCCVCAAEHASAGSVIARLDRDL